MEISPEDARMLLEICDLLTGPMDPEDAVMAIRYARAAQPLLEDMFVTEGIDVEDVVLRAVPTL
jgi:hypothetical protein